MDELELACEIAVFFVRLSQYAVSKNASKYKLESPLTHVHNTQISISIPPGERFFSIAPRTCSTTEAEDAAYPNQV